MVRDERNNDGAEVVHALAARLKNELGGRAAVDFHHYEVGYIAEVSVTPRNTKALKIAVTGMSNVFVVSVGSSRWRRDEIPNTSDGVAELSRIISDALDGRAWGKRAKHAPY